MIDKLMEIVNDNNKVVWASPYYLVKKRNGYTGHVYSGVNRFMLANKLDSFYFTFKQVQKVGGYVKKGAKGSFIVFYKQNIIYEIEKDEEGNEIKKVVGRKRPIMQGFYVFGLNDVELPDNYIEEMKRKYDKVNNTINVKAINQVIDEVIKNAAIDIRIEYSNAAPAYYSLQDKMVVTPELDHFISKEESLRTVLHEIGHAIRHQIFPKKVLSYAGEEVAVEMASVLVSAHYGYDGELHNNAAYIKSWGEIIKDMSGDKWLEAIKFSEKLAKVMIGNKEEKRLTA